jgi:hypothetical protein
MLKIKPNIHNMPYKKGVYFTLFWIAVILFSGCKKSEEEIQRNLAQEYFDANIINKDIIVRLASDSGVVFTSVYNGYIFKLLKNTYLDGPLLVNRAGINYLGTWSCNDDYGKLTINLPASNADFKFLNREWRFVKKSMPIMELAPWGTTEPKLLHMERL